MPKNFNTGAKDPFQDLSPEYRDAIDGSDRDQIKARITQVYLAEAENQRNKREDLDVQGIKIKVDRLSAPYKFRAAEAKLAAKVSSRKEDHAGATQAALDLVKVEDDESTDNDLLAAKDEYATATEQYTDATKQNKLRIKYCLSMLDAKGGVSRSSTAEIVQSLREAVPGATMTFVGPDGQKVS